MFRHALEEAVDGGNVGAVAHISSSRTTAGEQAGKSALTIDDTTAEPDSPGLEKGPDLELRDKTVTSFDI